MKTLITLLFILPTLAQAKTRPLNLERAQEIVQKAIECGEKFNWKLSVAVVNAEGNLMAFARMDGAYLGSIETAIDKAKSANAFQRPTSMFSDAIKDGRIGVVTVKNVIGIEGGVPLNSGSEFIGAIGVSGAKSTEDEQCAKIAAEKK
jgi:glc operon protein GlcG